MSDRYVTRQTDALELIADRPLGEIALTSAWRGGFHPPSTYIGGKEKTIPKRVWERLLDRGDLEILEGWGASSKSLRITEQGLERIGRRSANGGPASLR